MSNLQLLQALGGGSSPLPAPEYLVLNDDVHIHIDANSIYAAWVYAPIEALLPLSLLTDDTGITWSNSSIPGQDWLDMNASADDVDGAYVPGKTNVLVIGETTNSIFNEARSVAQTLDDMELYLANRMAANPWDHVVMLGTIPRGGTAGDEAENDDLRSVDISILADLPGFGIDAFINFRDMSPFFHEGTAREGFMTSILTCLESVAPYIHPIGSARDLIASRMATRLQQIPI